MSKSKPTGSARTPNGRLLHQSLTCEEDAAGAVDGVKDGKWGFHTEARKQPVVAGGPGTNRLQLDRVVIYNRCDGFAERNSRLLVLLSS